MSEESERDAELREFAAHVGFTMTDYALLDRALTHASTASDATDPLQNYESLEFLGDAVLGMAVAHYLYEHVPDRSPGEYSKMRAAVVNRRCLARIAKSLGIAPLIQLGRGEEMAGGRTRKALLADCLESVIGAVYLDQGWKSAQQLVDRVFDDELKDACLTGQIWDFKSRLQNHCQARRVELPKFRVVSVTGPDHKKYFEVEVVLGDVVAGRGAGPTKKEAEQKAARLALIYEGVIEKGEEPQ